MALRFMEGFDKYGAGADLALRPASTSGTLGYNASGGRWGGGAPSCISGMVLNFQYPNMNANTGRVHLAFWVKFSALPGSATTFINLAASGDTGSVFQVDSAGNILWRDYGGTSSKWTGSAVVADLGWHHIELEVLIHTSGTARIWFDGVLQTTLASDMISVGSGYTALNRVTLRGVASTTFFDDVVVWDETGADFNTRQIGEHRIETTTPTSDSSVQFTPNAGGTNYTQVDEAAFHNSDTDYAQTTTIGHVDLYGMGALASSPTAILAVGTNIRAKKTDVGVTNMRCHIKNGGNDIESADFALTSSYFQYAYYTGLDPATTAAWANAAAVDSALMGAEYQS